MGERGEQWTVQKGMTLVVKPGDHFNLLLPDGSLLNVEQTGDDFSIVRGNGIVAYTKPTSHAAIHEDEEGGPLHQTTGYN